MGCGSGVRLIGFAFICVHSRLKIRLNEVIFFDAVAQDVSGDAELSCGGGLVPACAGERVQNEVAFLVGEA